MANIGAHVSIAGGLYHAFERSAAIGGTTLQVFSKSPRGWTIPRFSQEEYDQCLSLRKQYQQIGGIIHSNYLANLSKPLSHCEADIKSIIHDFDVAHHTGFDAVNVHIGKQKGFESKDTAFKNMITNVEFILNINQKKGFSPQFVFENTAGQGSELGSTIEELGYFFRTYCQDFPIKICIDTAHCRGGGVDLSQFEDTIDKIQQHIGVEHIYAFHLNDAKVTLGSHLDRHASLGRGFIGREVLAPYIQRAAQHDKSLIIETPKTELRAEEIELVNKIVAGDTSWISEHDKKFMKSDILKKFQHSEEGSSLALNH